jgi:hypothetical protein
MDHIGIDVHKKDSQICILTEQGELLERHPLAFCRGLDEDPRPWPGAQDLAEPAWLRPDPGASRHWDTR